MPARALGELNTIHPYRWRADYRGGGRLLQFDVDGPHKSTEIDRQRVAALTILGHPDGPIAVRTREVPDKVFVKLQGRLAFGPAGLRHYRWVVWGFRLRGQTWGRWIDEAGHVYQLLPSHR